MKVDNWIKHMEQIFCLSYFVIFNNSVSFKDVSGDLNWLPWLQMTMVIEYSQVCIERSLCKYKYCDFIVK